MSTKHYLNRRAEFKDKKKEEQYFQEEISRSLGFIRQLLLAVGILYLLFAIPDYLLINNPLVFGVLLGNRVLFFVFILIIYYRLSQLIRENKYARWITAYELLITVSFLLVYALYESPSLTIQSWGAILILLGFYLVPNRWTNIAVVSVLVFLGFFTVSFMVLPDIEFRELAASLFYLLLILIFSLISSWRTNCDKRVQYLYMKRIKFYSDRDALTGLYNRFRFEQELLEAICQAVRYQTPFSLIFYDIDDFKRINDRNGHLMGDNVLVKQAQLVARNIRDCDIYARWGGEEFIIILTNTEFNGALEITRRIKELIAEYPFGVGSITCSFGVTDYRGGDDKDAILYRVDRLLYEAKRGGKNQIVSG